MAKTSSTNKKLAVDEKSMYNWSTTTQPYYITQIDVANSLINTHLASYAGHVGFDLEWPPSFAKGEVEKPVSLVQIATRDATFLFQISAMGTFPAQLKRMLENPGILKVGVNIQNDAIKLFRDWQISTLSCVELSYLARSVDNAHWKGRYKEHIGLARLTDVYLDATLLKGKISRSNWGAQLTPQQRLYAANDAHAGFAVYVRLFAMKTPNVEPTYYSFHVIRGRLYQATLSSHSSFSNEDHLWGLTSTLQPWFPSNPFYDPGPPPEAKAFKPRATMRPGNSPSLSNPTALPPSRNRHRPRIQETGRPTHRRSALNHA